MEEDDEGWTEEEVLVYVQFDRDLQASELEKKDLQFKIIGLDESPVCEVNGKLFKGEYEYSLGTKLFFTENPNHPKEDPIISSIPEKYYQFLGKTDKVIRMERLYVEEKEKTDKDVVKIESEEVETALESRLVVTETYQEALDKILPTGQMAPRTVKEKLDSTVLSRRDVKMEFYHEDR